MGFFKKLFGSKQSNGPDISLITRAIGILKKVYESRTPITLTFDEVETQYTTLILDIKPSQNMLILDEITPPSGNRLMKERQIFHAKTSDHGVLIKFSSLTDSMGIENNIAFYRVKIPSNLEYLQKRGAFRADVPMSKNVTLALKTHARKALLGRVCDLSLTGCRVSFEANLSDEFHGHEILKSTRLKLSKDQLVIDIEVRHAGYDGHKRQTILGCRFLALTPQNTTSINQFLSGLQREMRRKESGL